jgi:hypothetical protein
MKNYSIEVETAEDGSRAVVIGGGYIAQKLAFILNNRGLASLVISKSKDLDMSSTPEFIFLFNPGDDVLPEMAVNFIKSIKPKLIIVSIDKPCGENIIKQCLDKEIDYCSAEIYDLFGGGPDDSGLGIIFSEIKKKKLISFRNDQIIITPVFIDDAAEALCRVAFSTQTFKQKFLLTGKEEIPLVGFSQRVGLEASRISGLLLNPVESGALYPETIVRHEKILRRDESYSLLSWKPDVKLDQAIKLALGNLPVYVSGAQQEVKKKTILNQPYFLQS